MEVVYRGQRSNKGVAEVFRIEDDCDSMESKEFKPNHDYCDKSPFFEWGYAGPGSIQLAHNILYDYSRDEALADNLHIRFAAEVICNLDENRWRLTQREIAPFILSVGLANA